MLLISTNEVNILIANVKLLAVFESICMEDRGMNRQGVRKNTPWTCAHSAVTEESGVVGCKQPACDINVWCWESESKPRLLCCAGVYFPFCVPCLLILTGCNHRERAAALKGIIP